MIMQRTGLLVRRLRGSRGPDAFVGLDTSAIPSAPDGLPICTWYSLVTGGLKPRKNESSSVGENSFPSSGSISRLYGVSMGLVVKASK